MNQTEMNEGDGKPSIPNPPIRTLTFNRIFLKGLAITLPAILTFVILVWVASLLNTYIISPTNSAVRYVIALMIEDSLPKSSLVKLEDGPPLPHADVSRYRVTKDLKKTFETSRAEFLKKSIAPPTPKNAIEWLDPEQVYVVLGENAVPYSDYKLVAEKLPESQIPVTSTGVYMEVVIIKYFQSMLHLSLVALLVVVVLIYFVGRFVTVKLGSLIVQRFEHSVIGGLPVVRNVYSSVKQITDFLFSENEIEFRRVVAFEYPRRGIWSVGFVTGETLLDIAAAEGEQCVAILVPTSPMPMTGYTISVPKSAVVDLDITIEQAFQFIVSCGVLVPPHQKVTAERLKQAIEKRTTGLVEQAHQITQEHAGQTEGLVSAATHERKDEGSGE